MLVAPPTTWKTICITYSYGCMKVMSNSSLVADEIDINSLPAVWSSKLSPLLCRKILCLQRIKGVLTVQCTQRLAAFVCSVTSIRWRNYFAMLKLIPLWNNEFHLVCITPTYGRCSFSLACLKSVFQVFSDVTFMLAKHANFLSSGSITLLFMISQFLGVECYIKKTQGP